MNGDNINNEPKVDYLEKRVIVVDGVKHKIIFEFFMPQLAWQKDYKAYIIEYKGEKRLVKSVNDNLHLVDNDVVKSISFDGEKMRLERDQLWLTNKIREYEDYIKDIKEALNELEN